MFLAVLISSCRSKVRAYSYKYLSRDRLKSKRSSAKESGLVDRILLTNKNNMRQFEH
jgi:hypothetical protein